MKSQYDTNMHAKKKLVNGEYEHLNIKCYDGFHYKLH